MARRLPGYQSSGGRPADEEAARGLMTCYAKLGDLSGVRGAYKVLTQSDDEKAERLPETHELMESLLR